MTNKPAIHIATDERLLNAVSARWGRIAEDEGYVACKPKEEGVTGVGLVAGPHAPEKSALFQRLLAGKEPLIQRPPTFHSYPWYSVVESNVAEFRVFVGGAISMNAATGEGKFADALHICINGAPWRVLECLSETEYLVTWGQMPMQWRLMRKQVEDGNIQLRLKEREEAVRAFVTKTKAEIRSRHDTGTLHSWNGKNGLTEGDIEAKIKTDLAAFEAKLRSPDHPSIHVDAKGICWTWVWNLRRIGLPGWPLTGKATMPTGMRIEVLRSDQVGPCALFDTQCGGEAATGWVRVEHDPSTKQSRYIGVASSRSALMAKLDSGATPLQLALDEMDRADYVDVLDCKHGIELMPTMAYKTRGRPAYQL